MFRVRRKPSAPEATPAVSFGDGALAGTYAGASAGASVGVGLGANALVGGNSKNFALQPLSGETGTGVNVAAGVSRLELKATRQVDTAAF
ncbi:DUF992 domain-containing protein [Rhizobium sp. BK275]|uniref:DUF992 domain-containing protein n=1 Tax=Rhizobium sp. BK275 TaxID=2587077 RepID=UPI0032B2EB80